MTSILRTLAILALSVLVSSAAAQQRAPAEALWKKHTFVDDQFEVEFSGPIRSQAVQLDVQTRRRVARSMQHMQDAGEFLFIVGAQHNIDAVNFDGGARASFSTLNCKTVDGETDLPLDGGRGRELKGRECVNGLMRAEARYFERGKWFYQVIAIFPSDDTEAAAARRFLASFRIIGK